jgi:hypothetical protein
LVYNSGNTYTKYTSSPETTVIEFPSDFNVTATYDTQYIFTPAQFVEGNTLMQTITYSIK